MIEVEILGAQRGSADAAGTRRVRGARMPPEPEVRRLCALALDAAGIAEGHLAIEFVDAQRIAELNGRYRSKAQPTDVLSFPVDGTGPAGGERELGDVVICLEHTRDAREAIIHGVLHLLGMDHETDEGEMLALQSELLSRSSA
ncbi:MAG TPA: rRNA maturation RNase YbeY [Solirubrobacteraceae bacterium]|jgi:probable rRNA maturation factor|nr:rRNA maturation RNase YbeY [Solirubrobacteraceae bacterium]